MCVRFGMQSIPVPAHFAFMQPHGIMEESSADRNQRLGHLRYTELSNAEVVLAAHGDLLPKGSVKHDATSNSLLKEGMHRTAAITACITIWLFPLPELTGLLRTISLFLHQKCFNVNSSGHEEPPNCNFQPPHAC